MTYRAPLAGLTAVLAFTLVLQGQEAGPVSVVAPQRDLAPVRLVSTTHVELPATLAQYWLVPELSRNVPKSSPAESPAQQFARGARLINTGDFAGGLPLVSGSGLAQTSLGPYARFYAAMALIGLSRHAEADAILTALSSGAQTGYLSQAVPVTLANVALARNDARRAADILRDTVRGKLLDTESILMQLAVDAERANDPTLALDTYRKIYFDYPLSAEASDAEKAIDRLRTPDRVPTNIFALEKARAEALFAARRWPQAREAFESLSRVAEGNDKKLTAVRMAACDYYQNRHRAAREALAPFLDDPAWQAEARFYYLSATRGLGDQATYVRLARKLVEDYPRSTWAEETLNNLASHFITSDDEAEADLVFRQLLAGFPKSRYGERAAWRIGWRAYRAGEFREAADTFERAAESFPRADNRPAWLYWSGRARQQLNERAVAASRYALVVADYQNSYYGRLADKLLSTFPDALLPDRLNPSARVPGPVPPLPTDALIRDLVSLELYDDALREVRFAQRVWGDSPQLQATTAFIRHNQAVTLKADERFSALRGAITTMRRAYPQFMAAGGEQLPDEVLRIIFPLDYWPLITKYSAIHDLDPYLIAALMAQESTFTAEIRSSANAYGLMQLIPSTGRRYATRLGIRNFTTNSLKNPETNVRLGTEYFKELMTRFGGAHYALAGYNAGENRVQRWLEEKGPLPADEFVDDIPFAETQNYVKRILGTAEDYRRLYSPGRLDPSQPLAVPVATSGSSTSALRKVSSTAKPASSTAKPASTAKPSSSTSTKKPASQTSKKKAAISSSRTRR